MSFLQNKSNRIISQRCHHYFSKGQITLSILQCMSILKFLFVSNYIYPYREDRYKCASVQFSQRKTIIGLHHHDVN
jgi:hypothetical protein